jgi:predicted anti-sigma-YlaC factor YlaD
VSAHLDVQALTPEAALGLLAGSERAAVLQHLDGCEQCRELMHELSAVADDLVLLAPGAEPPAGFEQRVLTRLGVNARRRRWPIVAGSIAAALLVVVGFALGRSDGGPPSPVHEVTMRAPSGRAVGDAYVHGNDPTWVFVAVSGWTGTSTEYRLRVTYADGTTTEVPGAGSWGTVLPVDASQVRELSVVGTDGRVWCSASV